MLVNEPFFLLLFISSCCREVAWLQALHICGSLLTCPLVWCSAGTDGWWVGWWGLVVVVVVVVSICDILYTNISRQIHCPVINLFYSEPSTTQCPGDLNNNNEKRKIKKNESKNHMSIAVFKYFETSQVIAKFTFAKQLVHCFLLSWILICSAVKDLRTVGKYFITYI